MAKQLLSKEMQARKEELRNELNKISTIEEQEIINQYYPEIKKQYEGKYFKCRNGYSSEDRWWMYTKIMEIKPDDVYDTGGNGVTAHFRGLFFETTSNGTLSVETNKFGYIALVGTAITKAEYDAAWKKAVKNLKPLGLKFN